MLIPLPFPMDVRVVVDLLRVFLDLARRGETRQLGEAKRRDLEWRLVEAHRGLESPWRVAVPLACDLQGRDVVERELKTHGIDLYDVEYYFPEIFTQDSEA